MRPLHRHDITTPHPEGNGDADELRAWGFAPFGRLHVDGAGGFKFIPTSPSAELNQCIYAWTTNDGCEILRMGSSKYRVKKRSERFAYLMSKFWNYRVADDDHHRERRWRVESREWHRALINAPAMGWVFQPVAIRGPLGPVRPYLAIEAQLLLHCRPRLNAHFRS